MDNSSDVIFEPPSSSISFGVLNFPALIPFPATTNSSLAQLVTPLNFPSIDSKLTEGLRWDSTNVNVSNDHGSYKLYVCQRKGLAVWVPYGDCFYSNLPQASIEQTIGQYAERRSKQRPRYRPYGRPEGPVRISSNIRKDIPDPVLEEGRQCTTDKKSILAKEQDKGHHQGRAERSVTASSSAAPPPHPSNIDQTPTSSTRSSSTRSSKKKTKGLDNDRWKAFKKRKQEMRKALRIRDLPPHPPISTDSSLNQSLEVTRQEPPSSNLDYPSQAEIVLNREEVERLLDESALAFGDFSPINLDEINELIGDGDLSL